MPYIDTICRQMSEHKKQQANSTFTINIQQKYYHLKAQGKKNEKHVNVYTKTRTGKNSCYHYVYYSSSTTLCLR